MAAHIKPLEKEIKCPEIELTKEKSMKQAMRINFAHSFV